MTDQGKRHIVGGFRAYFPLAPLDGYQVRFTRLDLHQRIREHDTATIRVRSKGMDWFRHVSTDSPVRITYWSADNRQNLGVFVGYVTHVRLVSQEDNTYEREIVCVAASRVLRQTAQTTYTNMTAAEIVEKIGRMFHFKVVTKQHGLRRGTVVQAGESYWQFLIRLAKRTGYALRVEGTTLLFLPIRDMVAANIGRAPLLSDYRFDMNSKYRVPSVTHIDSWVGNTSDDDEYLSDPAIFTSVAPDTGQVATAIRRPESVIRRNRSSLSEFDRFMSTGVAAHSRYDADLLAQGAADNGLMALDTRLTVTGNPLLSPYRPVELSLKDRALSGYWLVKEVTHTVVTFGEDRYLSEVTVSTDSVSGLSTTTSIQQPGYRDRRSEEFYGLSQYESEKSRLTVSRNGFVSGSTADGNVRGRWVHG